MPDAQKVAQDPERVFAVGPDDYHGIRPYADGFHNGWCGHCHRTYDAARKCSLQRWTDASEFRLPPKQWKQVGSR